MSTTAPPSLIQRIDELELDFNRIQSLTLPGPSDLFFIDTVVPHAMAGEVFQSLVHDLLPVAHQRQVGNRTEPRKIVWFGPAYSYSGKTIPANNEWHPIVLALKDWLVDTFSSGPAHLRLPAVNSCLVNFYENGSHGVGWHADDEPELGPNPRIASFSFGHERQFMLRTKSDQRVVLRQALPHGSLVVMGDGVQRHLQHCIPRTEQDCGIRVNLTFRFTRPSDRPESAPVRSPRGPDVPDAPLSAMFAAAAAATAPISAEHSSPGQEAAGEAQPASTTGRGLELEEGELRPTQELSGGPTRGQQQARRPNRIEPVLFDVKADELCGLAFERFLQANFQCRPLSTQRQFHRPGFIVHPQTWADHATFLTQEIRVPYRDGVEVTRRQPNKRPLDHRDRLEPRDRQDRRRQRPGRESHSFVIRGVPLCTDLLDAQAYLNETQGYTINGLLRIASAKTGLPTPLVRAFTTSAAQVEAAVTTGVRLGHQLHRCERSRSQPAPTPLQCTNCRAFGHSGGRCTRPPKCNRCGGQHRVADCATEEEATCANCGGQHRATYRQCPVAQEARRRLEERRQQQQSHVIGGRSYAAAAAPPTRQPAAPLGFPPMGQPVPMPTQEVLVPPTSARDLAAQPQHQPARQGRSGRRSRHHRQHQPPPPPPPSHHHQPPAPSAPVAPTPAPAPAPEVDPARPSRQQRPVDLLTMITVMTQVLQELLLRPREEISPALITQTVTSAITQLVRIDVLDAGEGWEGDFQGSGRNSPEY